jgi:hypothetical protein
VSQLFRWRKELCERQPAVPAFAAVAVAAPAPLAPHPSSGSIEIELVGGTRVRITGTMDSATLSATLAALSAPKRRP